MSSSIAMNVDMTLELKSTILKGLETTIEESLKKCVLKLSEKYNFNYDEALSMLGCVKVCENKNKNVKGVKGVSKSKSKSVSVSVSKSKVPLPWTGKINEEWCYGVKPNHGLFSQCQNKAASGKGDGELYGKLCSTCLKQCEKNSHGKPNGGLITERGGDFKSPSGKVPLVYSVVMKKLEIPKEVAVEEAAKLGLEIPESEFEVVDKKRGRPAGVGKKEENKEEKPKKRGRPKKEKRQMSVSNAEELLKTLEEQGEETARKVENPKDIKCAVEPESPVSDEEAEEESDKEESEYESEEEVNVVPVKIKGVEYYMIEEEAEEDGCEVMDESGSVVGRYKKTKSGAKLEKKIKSK